MGEVGESGKREGAREVCVRVRKAEMLEGKGHAPH